MKWLLCCLITLALGIVPAQAAEIIHDFDVTALIEQDGTVTITEKINVTAEHDQINHGIYRDIPTIYTDKFGNNVNVPLKIIRIERDGSSEDFHTESKVNGLRIYIGDKERDVPIGLHSYLIEYKVERVIGYFPDVDEFYWNVTGNGWIFPIQKSHISVWFPKGASILQSAGYTGRQGSQDKNFKMGTYLENVFEASITKPLAPYEGFTIAVGIKKGTMLPLTAMQKIAYFLFDNGAWLVFLFSTLGLAIYLFLTWKKFGDATPGLIIPRFDIPKDITPSLLRYIREQGYDHATFTSEIVNAAIKGYITIINTQDYTIIKKNKSFREKIMGEMSCLSLIFNDGDKIRLPKGGFKSSQRSSAIQVANNFRSSMSVHKSFMDDMKSYYFTNNSRIKMISLGISLISMGLGFYIGHTDEQKAIVALAIVIVHGAMIALAWKPMNKYTVEGQKIADYADGLKLYLEVAEQARLNELFPKETTEEIFEKFLPYAFALGVEQKWCEYFAEQVVKHSKDMTDNSNSSYDDRHHYNDNLQFGSLFNMSRDLGDLTSRISSASTPPASNSGSGGGGSSGGGGGGGGGGGW